MKKHAFLFLSLITLGLATNAMPQTRLVVRRPYYYCQGETFLNGLRGTPFDEVNRRTFEWFKQKGSSAWRSPVERVNASCYNQVRRVNNSLEITLDSTAIGRHPGNATFGISVDARSAAHISLQAHGGNARVRIEYFLRTDGTNVSGIGPHLRFIANLSLVPYLDLSFGERGTNTGYRTVDVTINQGFGSRLRLETIVWTFRPVQSFDETGVSRAYIKITPLNAQLESAIPEDGVVPHEDPEELGETFEDPIILPPF